MKTRAALAPALKIGDRALFLNPADPAQPERLVIGADAAGAFANTASGGVPAGVQLPANTLALDPAHAQLVRNP